MLKFPVVTGRLAPYRSDYNDLFKMNFGVDSREFQNYYRDLAK